MNNKKKLRSIKPQSIGQQSSCKIYKNESLCKYYKYLWWKCKLLETRSSEYSVVLREKCVNTNQAS